MSRLQWNQVQAPGFSDVSDILRNAAASWNEGFETLDSGLKDAHASQSRTASNSLIADMAGIQNEADIEPFLASLGDRINPANMTPDFAAAVEGLRAGVLGNDQTRANTGLIGANTSRIQGQEGRDQFNHSRGIANEDALAGMTNMFARAGILGFNGQGQAIGQNGQLVLGENGEPVTRERAMQSLPAGALSSDPQAQTRNNNSTPMSNDSVFNSFMGTVRSSGLNNPFALAAVAATVQHESGFSSENGNRTWNDPSETGRPGRAGGYMSWNNDRLVAMQEFTGGDNSPEAQAAYFMQEDPDLIRALNNAGSVEEATKLMNDAWRFAGYNREGGEAGARLDTAMSMVGLFQDGTAGPDSSNGYRANVDLPTDFDYSMGGVVRPGQIQDLLNGSIDQAVAGSNESRTARTDQQDYADSVRQFNEDQTTFNQGQEDRAANQATNAELEQGRQAGIDAARNSVSRDEAERVLIADKSLSPAALNAALGTLTEGGLESQFNATRSAPGTPSSSGAEVGLRAYVDGIERSETQTPSMRIANRALEVIGDADPAAYVVEQLKVVDTDSGVLRDTISRLARDNDISPAEVAVIMVENARRIGLFDRRTFLPGGNYWGDNIYDEASTQEMIDTIFSPEARKATDEQRTINTQNIENAQSAYDAMGQAEQRIAVWSQKNGGQSFEDAPENLQNDYNKAFEALRNITSSGQPPPAEAEAAPAQPAQVPTTPMPRVITPNNMPPMITPEPMQRLGQSARPPTVTPSNNIPQNITPPSTGETVSGVDASGTSNTGERIESLFGRQVGAGDENSTFSIRSIKAIEYIESNPNISNIMLAPNTNRREQQAILTRLDGELNKDTNLSDVDKVDIKTGLEYILEGYVGLANN